MLEFFNEYFFQRMRDFLTRKFFNWANIEIEYQEPVIINGRKITDYQLVRLFGVVDGSKISIIKNGTDYTIYIKNNYYQAIRAIYKDSDGNWIIHNMLLVIIAGKRKQGIGTRILGYQVKTARKLGFKLIVTIGTRKRRENGYYVWPVLGFEGSIPQKVVNVLKKKLIFTNGVQELIHDKNGQKLWKKHGTTIYLEFDLDPGSLSSRIHKEYLSIKGVKL